MEVGPNSIVPTPPAGDASNRAASTAFVTAAIGAIPPVSTVIPSGTVMLFFQAAAPTGWTQVVTQNDKALRVVSGTGAGTGGSTAFSTVFAQSATGATTLTTAQLPHQTYTFHGAFNAIGIGPYYSQTDNTAGNNMSTSNDSNDTTSVTDGNGGGSHTHTVSLLLQYIDVILCAKN